MQIESAHGVVIIALEPERVVQDPEELQSLAQSPCGARGYLREHLGDVISADLLCVLAISFGKVEDRLYHAGAVLVGSFKARKKARLYCRNIIGCVIGLITVLVDGVLRPDRVPLLLREDVGQLSEGAHKNDLLTLENMRLLRTRGDLESLRHTLDCRRTERRMPRGKIRLGKLPPHRPLHPFFYNINVIFLVHSTPRMKCFLEMIIAYFIIEVNEKFFDNSKTCACRLYSTIMSSSFTAPRGVMSSLLRKGIEVCTAY